MGANLFISKPSKIETLANVLKRILELDWSNPKRVAIESMARGEYHLSA